MKTTRICGPFFSALRGPSDADSRKNNSMEERDTNGGMQREICQFQFF